jgi:hypothetical protein
MARPSDGRRGPRPGRCGQVTGPVPGPESRKPRGEQRSEFARPIKVERSLALPARGLLMTKTFAGRPPVWGMKLLSAPIRLTDTDVERLEGASAG